MFSAVKIKGQPLYKLDREGKNIEREARKIHNQKFINYDQKIALLDITCSNGTYVRTLCQYIGKAINSSAYMSFLLRIQSGIFNIENSFTLAEISKLDPEIFLISMNDGLR